MSTRGMRYGRPSLAKHAAALIREAIRKGEWGANLPGGRNLAKALGVSRPVVYQAMKLLEAEGILLGERNAPRQVKADAPASKERAPKVIFLSPYQEEELEELPSHLAPPLGRELADLGLRLEFAQLPQPGRRTRLLSLDGLARLHHPSAWILYRCPPEVQEWFGERGHPFLVLGSSRGGIPAPRIDFDSVSAARHLRGRLLALGHDPAGIRFLTSSDRLSVHAANAAVLLGDAPPGDRVVGLDEDPETLARQIDAVLDTHPTAIVTQRAVHAKAVICRLWARGTRCPGDVSLVSLQDSADLALLRPEVSRYTVKPSLLFAAVSRTLTRVLQGDLSPRSGRMFTPEFLPGATLGRAPRG